MKKEKTPYKLVLSKKNLWTAWRVIRANGMRSESEETQRSVKLFDEEAPTRINQISSKLSRKSFKFDPAKGIAQRRPGKTPRPVVMATVTARVVQRSILDVLQNIQSTKPLHETPFSFGGIPEKGVETAVVQAQKIINENKAAYFVCSDIKGFFTGIKRSQVIEKIKASVPDTQFVDLFEKAMTTELSNMATLRENVELFPIHSTGVAQGCCLSPLVGNIYLNEFDKALNTSDVFCLRYIDDFLILGPSEKIVKSKFKQALHILKELGLDAYDPWTNSEAVLQGKCSFGKVSDGFDYLGCYVLPSTLRPSTKTWKRLELAIKESIADSLREIASDSGSFNPKYSFAHTVNRNNKKIEGWIKQYGFCTDHRIIGQWSDVIQRHFVEYKSSFFKLTRSCDDAERTRFAGVQNMKSSFLDVKSKRESKLRLKND